MENEGATRRDMTANVPGKPALLCVASVVKIKLYSIVLRCVALRCVVLCCVVLCCVVEENVRGAKQTVVRLVLFTTFCQVIST